MLRIDNNSKIPKFITLKYSKIPKFTQSVRWLRSVWGFYQSRRTNGRRFRGSQMADIAEICMILNQILLDVSPQAIQRVSTTDLPDPTDPRFLYLCSSISVRWLRSVWGSQPFPFFRFFFRFFCCEYNSTTDLPNPTDNYTSCLRTLWTLRTIRCIRAICVQVFLWDG